MTRFAMTPMIAALIILLTPTPGVAQYVTPAAPSAIAFQPCAFELSDVADGLIAACIWNRYSWTSIKDEYFDNFATTWVTDFDTALRGQLPWLYVNTHGGIVFEAYPPTSQGLAARDASYNDIVPRLYGSTIVVRQTMWEDVAQTIPRMYVILTVEGFVRTLYQGGRINNVNRSVAHFAGCDAWNFRSAFRSPNSGRPAAAFLSYNYDVTNVVVEDEGNTMYTRMSGRNGVTADTTYRPLHRAIQGLTARIDPDPLPSGTPDIVMSPRVRVTSFPQNGHLTAATDVDVVFDAPMSQDPPASIVHTEGDVYVERNSLRWVNASTLRARLHGLKRSGSGRLVLESYDRDAFDLEGFTSDGGIGLDGNTDPSGNLLGGEFPAGDDYGLAAQIDYVDNPAADVSGFAVVRGSSYTAQWHVGVERGTKGYVVTYADTWGEPFGAVTDLIPATGASFYQVSVPAWEGWYRLVEVETDGDTLLMFPEQPREPFVIPSDELVVTEEERRQVNDLLAREATENRIQSMVTEHAIVTVQQFLSKALSYQMFWNDWRGVPTEVVLLEDHGGSVGTKNYLASLPALRSILLYGRAVEETTVTGVRLRSNQAIYDSTGMVRDAFPSQADQNFVPMFYTIDPALAYWTPWTGTDAWWGDFRPGIQIGRAPVRDTIEAEGFNNKTINASYLSALAPGMDRVLLTAYAHDAFGNSGALAFQLTDSLKYAVPGWTPVDSIYDTPQHPFTVTRRDSALKARLDYGCGIWVPSGTSSQYYHFGGFAQLTAGFDPNTLVAHPDRLTLVIGAACGIAGPDRTENPAIGKSLPVRLLTLSNRGVYGIMGFSRGTWEPACYLFADEALRQIGMVQMFPTLGSVFAATLGAVRTNYPQYADQWDSAVLLGDPNVPIPVYRPVVGVDAVAVPSHPQLSTPAPNPGLAGMVRRLTLSLPTAMDVDLSVFDLAGRRVATILHGRHAAGVSSLEWDTRSSGGHPLAAGMYFLRLMSNRQSQTQKMVVLR